MKAPPLYDQADCQMLQTGQPVKRSGSASGDCHVNQLATEKALEKSRKKSSATLRNVARNSVES